MKTLQTSSTVPSLFAFAFALSVSFTGLPAVMANPTVPMLIQQSVAGIGANANVALFALGKDGAVYEIGQTSAKGSWSKWNSLGGTALKQLVVGNNADGRLEVFGLGGDNFVYHIWQTAPNGPWGTWVSLSGSTAKQMALTRYSDGALALFVVGSDGLEYQTSQAAPDGDWLGWDSLWSPQLTLVTKRISGIKHLQIDMPDSGDGFRTQNGFLLVTHNPGCGTVGNDGRDKFFDAAGKPLPPGCIVEEIYFEQFWPHERFAGTAWSWFDDAGSYGASEESTGNTVRWHNACVGAFSGKNLYYVVTCLIGVPDGVTLDEETFDAGSAMVASFPPPPGYQIVEPPPPPPVGSSTPASTKPLSFFYFKITCPSEVTPCSTLMVPATDEKTAQAQAQNQNTNCTVEQTNEDGYFHACD